MRASLREKITRIAYQNLYKHHDKGLNNKRKRSFHYTFLTLRNNILHWEINLENKSHPESFRQGYFGSTQHSELRAIVTFPYPTNILNRLDLWNIRINRHNQIACSRPCERCEDFISEFNFRHIFYTDNIGNWILL